MNRVSVAGRMEGKGDDLMEERWQILMISFGLLPESGRFFWPLYRSRWAFWRPPSIPRHRGARDDGLPLPSVAISEAGITTPELRIG